MNAEEMADYEKREQDLLTQLSVPLDSCIEQIFSKMKSDHEDLLHHQMALLRRSYPPTLRGYNVAESPPSEPQVGDRDEPGVMPVFIVTRTNSEGSLASVVKVSNAVDAVVPVTVSCHQIAPAVSVDSAVIDDEVTPPDAVQVNCTQDVLPRANCVTIRSQADGTVLGVDDEYSPLLENNCDKKRGHVEDAISNGTTLETKRHRNDHSPL